ncbi:MAG: hypothetical protein IIZ40_01765 [Bacilli bacterium]|nr:hypothetical protein [Bacilli bacterium]
MKKIFDIIFKFLIIILLYLSIIFNNDYFVLNNKVFINNSNSLKKYSSYKYVSFDIKDIEETRFMLDNKDKRETIYIVKIGNNSVLLELNENTVLTNKLSLMYMNDDNNTTILKDDLNNENDNKYKFIKGYYTNKNLRKNIKIINLKYTITIVFIYSLLILCIFDLIKIILKKN